MVVPLNVRLVAGELEYILKDAACRVVIVHPDLLPKLEGIRDRIGFARLVDIGGSGDPDMVSFDALCSSDQPPPDEEIEEQEIAFICYTSGTTGRPKGAMLSHRNVWAQAVQKILAEGWTGEDRVYLPFPLAFTGGAISVWMPTYVAGAALVLDSDFDPQRTLETIQRERISIFAAVPVIWEMIARHGAFAQADLTSLRRCSSGGAPVPEILIHTYRDRGVPLSQAYGLTEGGGMNVMLHSEDALRKPGFAGIPTMQARCRVVRPDGSPSAPGEPGELLIKGDEVMAGYWQNPAATAEALVDGWLHTGDLALMDEDGYIKILDRAKDMLISGGLNVYPAEIERVVAGFPGVAEVAVIGVPDPKWGEVPALILTPAGGGPVDEKALVAHCRTHLADYKVPRFVLQRDAPMPRSMSGKVLKRELREEYAGKIR